MKFKKIQALLFATVVLPVVADDADMRGCCPINNLTARSITVTGNEVVRGSLTAGSLLVNGNARVNGFLTLLNPLIALAAGGNLLDYGFFFSSSAGVLASAINLTTGAVSTGAYTALSGGTGTGVTVANAGTYAVLFYAYGANQATWTINNAGSPVTGATFNTAALPTGAGNNSSATGFAIVNVAAAGDRITLTGSNLVAPSSGNSVALLIVRLK